MITIEFKLTGDDGNTTYISKAIRTREDYEAFRSDLRNGIDTLEEIIEHELKHHNSNGTTGNHTKDLQPAGHQPAKVF